MDQSCAEFPVWMLNHRWEMSEPYLLRSALFGSRRSLATADLLALPAHAPVARVAVDVVEHQGDRLATPLGQFAYCAATTLRQQHVAARESRVSARAGRNDPALFDLLGDEPPLEIALALVLVILNAAIYAMVWRRGLRSVR